MDGKIKDTMEKAALAAGEILMSYYGKPFDIGHKDGKGIVSVADKEAEEKILSILLEEYKFSVIAEESGDITNDPEYCWVIDPLDGTTNFTRQIPFFCVSIALFRNGQPEAAVIYQPVMKELFFAERDKGAYLNDERLKAIVKGSPVVLDCNLGYSEEAVRKYRQAINQLTPCYKHIRNLGSSALELAYLAAGRLDCFLSYGDELYDIAAGILLARETACVVSNWEGNPWQIHDKGILVAPPELHGRIKKYLLTS